ncbi:hypothetical protein [Umboniibacter marinipuniceus]|nr:hypothetical protein [Umboniibacter marinipuniceus]
MKKRSNQRLFIALCNEYVSGKSFLLCEGSAVEGHKVIKEQLGR